MARLLTIVVALALVGSNQAQNIIRGEFFIDQDLGWGANTFFEITDDPEVAALIIPVDLTGYAPGTHTIGIRTIDDSAHWGLTNFAPAVVVVTPSPLELQVEVEYFFNEDPGVGSSPTSWLANDADLFLGQLQTDLSDATSGVNTLFIRSRTSDGIWSLTNHLPIAVIAPDTTIEIIDQIETFLLPEIDPGFGLANVQTVTENSADLLSYIFTAPAPFVEPLDTLMIRSHDANGRWSLTNMVIVDSNTSADDLCSNFAISTYPNPFTSGITVRAEDGKPLRVVLYDPQGKLVHDKVLTGETYIDLQELANGTYTAFFWKELERIHRVQLIKQ